MLDVLDTVKEGKPFLLFDADDREGETDIVVPADSTTFRDIGFLRKAAGGLICVAVDPEAARAMELPYARDVFDGFDERVDYDEHSAFSVWVNHRDTYTGVTDRDRALTARKLSEAVEMAFNGGYDFRREFSVPGHVPVLRGADGLTRERLGQTELSIEIARMAGVTPAMVVCEMLDDETGHALPRESAEAFAEKHGLPFVEGEEVIRGFRASHPA